MTTSTVHGEATATRSAAWCGAISDACTRQRSISSATTAMRMTRPRRRSCARTAASRSFDGRADFFTWLYRIAVNTALNALRSGKRGAALHQRGGTEAAHVGGRPEALGQGARSPAQHAQDAGEVARVLAAVAELSPALRVTIVLATIEELPHKQIAEILDVPEGTVAWRVNEARRLLKLRLAMTEPTTLAK